MGVVNKIKFVCNSGLPTEFTIGLLNTNDAGINAILATIPSTFGTYSYSHVTAGSSTSSVLTSNETSGCQATLFIDNVAYNSANACCTVINPALLISSDNGNTIRLGTDGKLYSTGYSSGG